MAVTPAAQGSGAGRAILTAVIEEARRIGARRLFLETNRVMAPAIHLYESLGFRHIPADRVQPSSYARSDVAMELFL
jgi:GNAT superfamily N-acetyltransferase